MPPNQSERLNKLLVREALDRASIKFDLAQFLFPEQLAFVKEPNIFATAVCSRRAGKTIACAADLIDTCLRIPKAVCLYITLSRSNAKKIIWPELKRINRDYKLKAKVNESDMSIVFPNQAIIYVSGAKDKSEIEKFRGLALALCYIDEGQSFKSYIQELIDDVISKALFDYNGRLRLTGTPGPIPIGYFYECSLSQEWAHHKWTMFNNPWIQRKSGKSPEDLLKRELKRKGVTKDDPSIQRECFGNWVHDSDSLVVRYESALNDFAVAPDNLSHFVLGVDIGHDDADAIAVIGWSDDSPKCYLVDEFLKRGQNVSELAKVIDEYVTKYKPVKVVMDTGGLGKKVADELRRRYALPIVAAEKSRKFEFIELMNDALRTQNLLARSSSQFAQDSRLLEWDRDAKVDKLKVKDSFHSDIIDAVLYAYREAMHWLYVSPIPAIIKGSSAYWRQQEQEMEEAALNSLKGKDTDELGEYEQLDPFNKRS